MPLLRQAGEVAFLTGRGMPVGLFDEPFFDEQELELKQDFSLTLFSDGVFEVMPKGTLAQREQQLRELVISGITRPQELRERLLGDRECPDDIAIMTLCRGSANA